MISSRWLDRRQIHWLRLEELVVRASTHGPSSLPHEELRELALLYRQTAADLSTVREDPTGARFAGYLNQLLGRTHNIIYRAPRPRSSRIARFYTVTVPRVIRATSRHTAISLALFMTAAVAGWFTTLGDPTFQRFLLGGDMVDTIERREMWTHGILAVRPLATSGIMTNNITVSLTVAAAGITAGMGTLLILLSNGLLMGVIGAACWRAGMSLSLWSFVAPHGSLELPAIFIAGGAGLRLAEGLLFPGLLPRKASLAAAGRDAVTLILVILPMLVVAAIIEGFVSPTPLHPWVKIAMGMVLLSAFVVYLARAARGPSPQSSPRSLIWR